MKNATYEYTDADKYITYLMAVFRYFGKQLFLVLDAGYCGQVISDESQDGIPKARTQGSVQQESSQFHACQTGRDGYQLAYGRVSGGRQRLIRLHACQNILPHAALWLRR